MVVLTADVNYFVRAHSRTTKSCLRKIKYFKIHEIDGSSCFCFNKNFLYFLHCMNFSICNVNFQSVSNFTPIPVFFSHRKTVVYVIVFVLLDRSAMTLFRQFNLRKMQLLYSLCTYSKI